MTWRASSGPAEAGFTLLEMTIVLVILGLALGLLALRGPMRSRGLELRAATEQLAQTLRAARAEAIAGDHAVDVTLPPGGYRLGTGRFHPLPGFSLSATTPVGAARPAIRFAADGSSSGGVVAVADGARKTQIAVDWLTGRVRIADAP
jgi:general secretion pathway protein H